MTGPELIAWRETMGWTQEHAAKTLGYSRRAYIDLEQSEKPLRDVIGFACAAIAAGMAPWTPNSGQ